MALDATEMMLDLGKRWSVDVSTDTAERLARFCSTLLTWNKSVNLTGAESVQDLVADHLPDSFAAARMLPSSASVVDVGAGGGLPGVPLAILRGDCNLTLVEPRSKRVAFLNTAVRVCGCVNAKVLRGRSDELGDVRFPFAMSRATFSPEDWLGIAPSLLSSGGKALVFATAELNAAHLRLLDGLAYESGTGASRWCGLFERRQ